MEKTPRKWMVLGVTVTGSFAMACIFSLQAPFFPLEAEKKGITASAYGFVFGIYELAIVITAPFIGANISTIGVKLCICSSMFVAGTCCILFGSLHYVEKSTEFIVSAYAIRILEGISQSTFTVTSIAILSSIYPETANDKVAVIISAFTAGMTISPVIGGVLYTVGGFPLPFYVLGIFIFVVSTFSAVFLTHVEVQKPTEAKGTADLLKCKEAWLGIFSVFTSGVCIGYISATLEPLLRRFQLQSLYTSLFFTIFPISQCINLRIMGILTDKGILPSFMIVPGAMCISVSFSLIFSLPGLPYSPNIYAIVIGLFLSGIGVPAAQVPGFGQILRMANKLGFPDNEHTKGMASGIFQMSIAFGIFVGATASGILLDYFGFSLAGILLHTLNVILFFAAIASICQEKCRKTDSHL